MLKYALKIKGAPSYSYTLNITELLRMVHINENQSAGGTCEEG